jgi:GT2 family glycosyltransferase
MPDLSVVIPTRGRLESLSEVLRALRRQERPPGVVEVVVALDANAAPEAGAVAERAWPAVKTVQATRPGASAARNTGWAAARAELVLFLDDDVVPSPSLVAEHVGWHRRHPEPEVGVLGRVRWSPRVKVTPFMRWLETGILFDFERLEGVEQGWQVFYSCNVSLKRTLLERAGGFDEERFPYGYEDLELARRLSEHGIRLLYNQSAVGEHLKTETLESWRGNLSRIARAERRFTRLYPDQRPYFYERFRVAAEAPPARGRSARLARFVGPRVPWLGRLVWRSYDLVCAQRLAAEFIAAWEAEEAADAARPSAPTGTEDAPPSRPA